MPKNDWDKKNDLDKWKKQNHLKQLKIQKIGRAITDKDNLASYRQRRIKRGFVGRDIFKLQKGRGFITGNTPFEVKWTWKKLLLVSCSVGFVYCSSIAVIYHFGAKVVAYVMAAVGILLISICFLVSWLNKNT